MSVLSAWAIEVEPGSQRFIGRYWSEDGWLDDTAVLPTRLFERRDDARDFLRKMKSRSYVAFPRARVVVVIVTVVVRTKAGADD